MTRKHSNWVVAFLSVLFSLITSSLNANDADGVGFQKIENGDETYLIVSGDIQQSEFEARLHSAFPTKPPSLVRFENVNFTLDLDRLFELGAKTFELRNSPSMMKSLEGNRFEILAIYGGEQWQTIHQINSIAVETLLISNFDQLIKLPEFDQTTFEYLSLERLPLLRGLGGLGGQELLGLELVNTGDIEKDYDISPIKNMNLRKLRLSGLRPQTLEGIIPSTVEELMLGELLVSVDIESRMKESGKWGRFMIPPTMVEPQHVEHLKLSYLSVDDAKYFDTLEALSEITKLESKEQKFANIGCSALDIAKSEICIAEDFLELLME